MKNPFMFGQTVTGTYYIKRDKIEDHISKQISDNQNIFITGERRCGKTSTILNVLKSSLKKSYIHIDLYGAQSELTIAKRVIQAIAIYKANNFGIEDALKSMARFRISATPAPDGQGFEIKPHIDPENYGDDISSALYFINKIAKKNKIAVFIDEFQEIKGINNCTELLGEMRAIIQQISHCSFIFAGSIRKQMDHLFRDPNEPFFKSALAIEFPKIPEENFYNFAKKGMNKKSIKLDKDIFHTLYNEVEGISGDMQQFCKVAFDICDENKIIDAIEYERLFAEVMKLEENFYKYTIYDSNLSQLQKNTLIGLAKFNGENYLSSKFKTLVGANNSSATSSSIARLEKLNIVHKDGKRIKFINPFFKKWLMKLTIE